MVNENSKRMETSVALEIVVDSNYFIQNITKRAMSITLVEAIAADESIADDAKRVTPVKIVMVEDKFIHRAPNSDNVRLLLAKATEPMPSKEALDYAQVGDNLMNIFGHLQEFNPTLEPFAKSFF
jgi:hypothetical protein